MKSKPHLFPHSYLPEPAMRKLVSFFGPIRIYLPWFMDPPGFLKDIALEIINPPEDFKPRRDFKAVLSGYHAWAEQNHDRSRSEIIKFSSNVLQDDSATWDIRRLLKGAAQPVSGIKGEDLAFKRHMLLHLASELESRHFEVMDMMDRLKEKAPVLAGALHDPGEAQGVFTDMDDITTAGVPDNMNIRSLLDAWFGLFSGYIDRNDLLITFDRRVMDYISSQWDERIEEEKAGDIHSFSFKLPDPSSEEYKEVDIMKIRELILGYGEDPDRCMTELHQIFGGVEEGAATALPGDALSVTLKYFSSNSCMGETPGDKDIIEHIAGKAVALME